MATDRIRTVISLPSPLRAALAAEGVRDGERLSAQVERLVRLGLRWDRRGQAALERTGLGFEERVSAALAAMESADADD